MDNWFEYYYQPLSDLDASSTIKLAGGKNYFPEITHNGAPKTNLSQFGRETFEIINPIDKDWSKLSLTCLNLKPHIHAKINNFYNFNMNNSDLKLGYIIEEQINGQLKKMMKMDLFITHMNFVLIK